VEGGAAAHGESALHVQHVGVPVERRALALPVELHRLPAAIRPDGQRSAHVRGRANKELASHGDGECGGAVRVEQHQHAIAAAPRAGLQRDVPARDEVHVLVGICGLRAANKHHRTGTHLAILSTRERGGSGGLARQRQSRGSRLCRRTGGGGRREGELRAI